MSDLEFVFSRESKKKKHGVLCQFLGVNRLELNRSDSDQCASVNLSERGRGRGWKNYLIKTIDERLNGREEIENRPVGLFLGLGRAVGGAGIAVAATRRRGWPGR